MHAEFGKEVAKKRMYQTPGTPRFKIVCPDNDANIIHSDLQGQYCSGVGMLLYRTNTLDQIYITWLESWLNVLIKQQWGLTLRC
jgi:hypothetical protein